MSTIIYPPDTTTMIQTDLAIGWMTGLNLTCDVQPIEESASMAISWNGSSKNLAPDQFRLLSFVLSSHDDMLPPYLSDLFPGKEFSLVPSALIGGPALPGRTVHSTATYDRRGVRGGAVSPVRTYRRYQFECMVTGPWTQSYLEPEKRYSWSLPCREKQYPVAP